MTALAVAPALVSARLQARLVHADQAHAVRQAQLGALPEGERVSLGHEWSGAVAEAFAGEGAAQFVAFETQGTIAGLAPLWLRRRFGLGLLSFLGSGPRDYSLADYQRLLVPDDLAPAAAAAFVDWLARRELPWHVASLAPVPASSGQAAELAACAQQRGWRVRRRSGGTSYVIDLPDTWDAYLERLPANLRQQLPRQLRKLDREHGVTWERVESAADLPEALADLRRLHTLRWHTRGKPGLLDRRVFRLVSRVAEQLLPAGHLDLVRLRIDGEVRAAILNFRYGRTVLFYLSGFDPGQAWSRYSLGNLIIARSIRDAIDAGCRRFDLLRGDEPYKPRFGGQPVRNERVVIYRTEAAYVASRLLARLDRVSAKLSMR